MLASTRLRPTLALCQVSILQLQNIQRTVLLCLSVFRSPLPCMGLTNIRGRKPSRKLRSITSQPEYSVACTRLARLIISLHHRRHHHHRPHQHHHHAHAGLVLFSVNGFTENTDNYSIFSEAFTEMLGSRFYFQGKVH